MVIDSSVLLSLLFAEGEEESLLEAILAAGSVHVSTANYLEAAMVAEGRKNSVITRKFDSLMDLLDPVYEPVTMDQAKLARRAFVKYGKGRHKAALNFGDCFAYALAKDLDEPLLFKGNDFPHTDVISAI